MPRVFTRTSGAASGSSVLLNRQTLTIDNRLLYCPQATEHPQEHEFDFSAGGNVYSDNPQPCIKELVDYVKGINRTTGVAVFA